jgi:hypothetical protein
VEQESSSLRGYALPDDAARGEHKGFIEELVSEFPMVGGSPFADVALAEKRRD